MRKPQNQKYVHKRHASWESLLKLMSIWVWGETLPTRASFGRDLPVAAPQPTRPRAGEPWRRNAIISKLKTASDEYLRSPVAKWLSELHIWGCVG